MAARVEERVAYVEGQVNELSQRLSSIEGAVRHLEQRMDVRFEAVDKRFDALEDKMSRQFIWLVGIVVTALVAMASAVLARG